MTFEQNLDFMKKDYCNRTGKALSDLSQEEKQALYSVLYIEFYQ